MNSLTRRLLSGALLACAGVGLAACASADNANSNTTATTNVAAPTTTPAATTQTLTEVERPPKVQGMMKERGEQDEAQPALSFASPREGATITGSTVPVKLNLSGDLKGYKPMKDPATGMGNHIHVILDNQPYEAYYDLSQPFELRNVTEGKHTLRVFASRPWHESYKNATAFQVVTFNVKGGGNAAQPTTASTGQKMADNANTTLKSNNAMSANAGAASNTNANAAAPPTREGKDMQPSAGGDVDAKKPLLTYSRPKGEYKGDDANAVMIDFWLSNAKLQGDGGEYRVRYSVDGGEAKFIDKWDPIWLSGWTGGKHTVKLELVDKTGAPVENGGYNTTTREITITK
ncbi:MAG: hypothetical protein QOF02_2963 [Blastocatellia bacterium]|nr:hypothetical protein [Blastocatellia bacterium]